MVFATVSPVYASVRGETPWCGVLILAGESNWYLSIPMYSTKNRGRLVSALLIRLQCNMNV